MLASARKLTPRLRTTAIGKRGPCARAASASGFNIAFYKQHGGAPNNEALQSAEGTLKAKARFDGPACEVYRRVGAANGALYLDLCNAKWQAIEVDSKGWRTVDRPSVRFIRPWIARELPAPESGGGIGDLRPFLNLDDEDFTLAVAWLLAALRNEGPYPVLVLTGEQGSAKSTCARMLRALVDPSEAPLRSVPRNEHDLFIAAQRAHVIALDNLSGVPAWLSGCPVPAVDGRRLRDPRALLQR